MWWGALIAVVWLVIGLHGAAALELRLRRQQLDTAWLHRQWQRLQLTSETAAARWASEGHRLLFRREESVVHREPSQVALVVVE
jgi:hypothetical protein